MNAEAEISVSICPVEDSITAIGVYESKKFVDIVFPGNLRYMIFFVSQKTIIPSWSKPRVRASWTSGVDKAASEHQT